MAHWSAGHFVQRRLRLTRNDDINRVRKDGQTLANAILAFSFLPNQLKQNRIAIIAGRRVGGAVQRNFAKRRLRSAIQSFAMQLNQGYDLVLIARKPILTANYASIVNGLKSLALDAGLMKDKAN